MNIQMPTWDNDVLTIRQLLDYTAESFGEKICIRYEKDSVDYAITYNQMRSDSYQAAYCLSDFEKGMGHIGICAKTDYIFLCYLNGIFISGNIAIPFGPDTPAEQLKALIKQADITTFIADKEVAEKIGNIEGVNLIVLPQTLPEHTATSLPENNPDACALIMFTSGTTGKMKGAMLTNRALISNVYFKEMNNEGDRVALNVLPMHHIFCFSCDYLKNLKDGVTICLNGSVENITGNLLKYEPHFIRLVPMMIETLLRKIHTVQRIHPEYTPRQACQAVYGSRLNSIIAAGAKLPDYIGDEYEKMGVSVRQGYGMTETGPRISVPNGTTDSKSAGAIISICETRFVNGELQVRSPSVMSGYYKDEEETKKVFTDDGWFRTGDIGCIKNGNHLYITGRLKNLIILSNGENISPEELERNFVDNKLVIEVMVYEEKDKIAVEFYPDFEYAEISKINDIQKALEQAVSEANAKMPSEKEIRIVKIRNTPFERTSSGKIIRKKNV